MNLFDFIAPIYGKVPFAKKSFEKIYKLGQFQRTDKVLDVGGGPARIAKFFVGKVKEITLVDVSRNMIKQCQKQNGVSCILAAAENFPFSENYFDKIIIIDAFHHFSDQKRAVQEIKRVVKSGGKVILEEFYFGRFLTLIAEKFETLIGAKSKLHSPQSLANLFRSQGFKTEISNKNKFVYYLIGEKIGYEKRNL